MTLSLQSQQVRRPEDRPHGKKLEDKKVERLLAILAKKMESAREGKVRVA